MKQIKGLALITLLSVLVAGCSTLPPPADTTQWQAKGKIQFRDRANRDSFSGNFQWANRSDGFQLAIQGPLAMGSMVVDQTDELATLSLSNGNTHRHHDAGELLSAALDQPVPILAIEQLILAPENAQLPDALNDWQINRRNYQTFDGFAYPIATKIDLEKDNHQIKLVIKSLQQL